MKYLCLFISAFALVLGACESHSWEDQKDEEGNVIEKGTKRLFETHDTHGAGHEAEGETDEGEGEEGKGHDAAEH